MEITLTEQEWANIRQAGALMGQPDPASKDVKFIASSEASWHVVRFRGMADKQVGGFTPVVHHYPKLMKTILTTEVGETPCLL